ncbi:hypothetical protein [uncultured Tenacibaculum sp.]|uniref:hypothetical protein n=1 Tax=uncultured Tenacibaculum sp. TaxID=174713 RepID=UPI00261BDA28|nr:hypothetical protein [uncultured Tenacibaculum sp.]
MMKRINIFLILILMVSCAPKISYNNISARDWSIQKEKEELDASFSYFSGSVYQDIAIEKDDELKLIWNTNLEKGAIEFLLINTKGEKLWNSTKQIKTGTKEVNVPITEKGIYKIEVKGYDASGKFDLKWK